MTEGKENTQTQAQTETQMRTETLAAPDDGAGTAGIPGRMDVVWGFVVFLAGVAAALLGVWLRSMLKKEKTPAREETEKEEAPSGELVFSIGKLHELGGRENQQDSFSVSAPELMPTHGLLAVVADGMGGLADGDRMSQSAITAVMETFYRLQGDPDRILLMLVERATQAVNEKLGQNNYNTSGSTLVAGLIKDGAFHYVSVGDSRICLYRDGFLYQLNREHVFRRELEIQVINHEASWETVDMHPRANGLTSFLGMGSLKYVDIPAEAVQIRPGDKFILMSDGVYNSVDREELTGLLGQTAEQAAEGIGKVIAEKNLSGQDNYTAIIIAC